MAYNCTSSTRTLGTWTKEILRGMTTILELYKYQYHFDRSSAVFRLCFDFR
jgi:hypothetical protein